MIEGKNNAIEETTTVGEILETIYATNSDEFIFKRCLRAVYEELKSPEITDEDTIDSISTKFRISKITIVEIASLRRIDINGIRFMNTYIAREIGIHNFIPEPELSLDTTLSQLIYMYPTRSIREPIRAAARAVEETSLIKGASSLSIREFHAIYSRFIQHSVGEKLRIGIIRHQALNNIFKNLDLPQIDIPFSMEL
jgi:hypothetical protein